MRHRVFGRTLNRNSAHRKAMRRNMAIALIQHGAIRTTTAKAKELKGFVERLITMARKQTVHARRLVSAELGNRRGRRGLLYDDEGNVEDKGVLDKLFDEIAPRYADRPGGYTRIIRLAQRRLGDGGEQVILQLVEQEKVAAETGGAPASARKRRAAKRHEAMAAIETAEVSESADEAEQAEPGEAADAESEAPAVEDAEPADDDEAQDAKSDSTEA